MVDKDLWERVLVLTQRAKATNTDESPLPCDAKLRDLQGPCLYYQRSKCGGLHLVLKYKEQGWAWVSMMHDLDGDELVDDDHIYDIYDVVAKRNFEVLGTDMVIEHGFKMTKAYPAS